MNTNLKNQWIALEEEYQALLKEKVNKHNLNNTSNIIHPSISSQMTFCSDGVIIKKLNNGLHRSGISVKVFDKTIAEMKTLDQIKNGSNGTSDKLYLPIIEYKKEEIAGYNPKEAADQDFSIVING
ncbi:hypothetical protein ERX46_10975 [Brumimicrobium glaciale]|uniref:Uncharacterized protein n=1 Tax=Brumimicrobium glaciale TaxID=200475 RepID=A0A4Q4KJS4_9FLAO|nr:hypothetical protein [Brumimicrobium glaciale]RYM33455.1 hypothetical protein ERX46_10975 [Brumimicrobium glaciale]